MDLFGSTPKPDVARVGQIKEWVRQHFALSDEAVVMVTELRCSEPGCPPLETVIAILDGPGSRRQHKLHKSVAELEAEDIAAIPL